MMNLRKAGYSLIEFAIGLAIIGIVLIVVVRFSVGTNQRMEQLEAPQTLIAADKAIVGFLAARSRLPCPDVDSDGLEDCGDPAAVGQLPYVDLGLARADMKRVRYGVFRGTDAEVDLTAKNKDRFKPLMTIVPTIAGVDPSALPTSLGVVNGIDFCNALRLGNALPRGASTNLDAVHIKKTVKLPNGTLEDVVLKNVAYALSLPSSDSDPATNINNSAYAFATPANPLQAGSQDSVIAMDFGQIFDRLSCAGVLAATSHAHPNIASAAAIMTGAMLDYKVQLDLQLEIAEVGVLSGGVGVAGALGGVASSAADLLTGISETISTFGGMSAGIALSAVAVGLSAASVVTAGIALDNAIASRDMAKDRVHEFSGTHPDSKHILEDMATLATAIRAHAVAVDAAGIYR